MWYMHAFGLTPSYAHLWQICHKLKYHFLPDVCTLVVNRLFCWQILMVIDGIVFNKCKFETILKKKKVNLRQFCKRTNLNTFSTFPISLRLKIQLAYNFNTDTSDVTCSLVGRSKPHDFINLISNLFNLHHHVLHWKCGRKEILWNIYLYDWPIQEHNVITICL